MPKRTSIKKDLNQAAYDLVQQATSENQITSIPAKNPAAVALGRLGGLKGGTARAARLSAKRRKAIARKAAQSRWKRIVVGAPIVRNKRPTEK